MSRFGRRLALLLSLPVSTPLLAGEIPLYEKTPDWVTPARLPDATSLSADTPTTLIYDMQQRIEGGTLWSYVDTAQRASNTEMLGQLATLTVPWLPDKGDLRIHELSIVRDGQTIDLLAGDKRFTVLRREESLEQRELNGVLTATMPVEGLRVGDILRFRFSTTGRDKALGGRVQSLAPILAAPLRLGQGHMRILWSNDSAANFKMFASGVEAKPVKGPAFTQLDIALPAPKQPEMPNDAPLRFRPPALLEISTFTSWQDVSKVMAPLFATDGLIGEQSPLKAEIDTIMKAETTPLGRAQRALQLVQDKVRYLALSMDGGNYVPQSPEQTWTLRYGDCKAKTLLLLSLLRAMGIESEAVLAHTQLGDLVGDRLPSAAAFNHVIVHARIDGQSLWLDGTGMGARIDDIYDTPPFHMVLPLRPEGAALLPVVPRLDARPTIDVDIEENQSTSTDLPSVFTAKLVLRGGAGTMLNLMRGRLDKKQQQEMLGQLVMRVLGEAQFSEIDAQGDDATGQLTIKATGVRASAWRWSDKALKRALDRSLNEINFSPERARPAWAKIPVATPDPEGRHFRLHLRLPDGGRGFSIDGVPVLDERIAGYAFKRSAALDGGYVTVDERIDSTGAEIPTDRIAAERDRLETTKARQPRLIAPAGTLRFWDVAGKDAPGADQIKAAEAVYAKAIADDPEEVTGYQSRGDFRRGIGDRKGAMADYGKAIDIEPSVDLYLARAGMAQDLGDLPAALADAEAARQLDPSSIGATTLVANLRAEKGDLNGAVGLIDQRIDLGGETRQSYREAKVDLIGHYGDPAEALKLVDELIADKPGSPSLLNLRCWLKGTRSVDVDNAVKDCTSAIELSGSPFAALDSRALIFYRLGRYEDALRDLDAVLREAPGLAASRYMRGVLFSRLNRAQDSAADLAIARRLSPRIDVDYARFGIKP